MPSGVTGYHETEAADEDETEKVTMTIESTNIRNSTNPQLTYMFKVFV